MTQVCSACNSERPADPDDEPHADFWVRARHQDGRVRLYQRRCKMCVRERQRAVKGMRARGERYDARKPRLTAEERNARRRARHAERTRDDPTYAAHRRETARRRRRAAGIMPKTPGSRRELDLLPIGPLQAWLHGALREVSQRQLAQRAGLSERRLYEIRHGYSWKNGKRYEVKNISSATVDKLLIAAGSCSIVDLYPL